MNSPVESVQLCRMRTARPQPKGDHMRAPYRPVFSTIACLALGIGIGPSASADTISDWNEKAVGFVVAEGLPPPQAERIVAMAHVAMFDAVNSITPYYRPYLAQQPAAYDASKEAAAATAAGTVLAGIDLPTSAAMTKRKASHLISRPCPIVRPSWKASDLARLQRSPSSRPGPDDGSRALDTYRPYTTPGGYVPTAPSHALQWGTVEPFARTGPGQSAQQPARRATWAGNGQDKLSRTPRTRRA